MENQKPKTNTISKILISTAKVLVMILDCNKHSLLVSGADFYQNESNGDE